MMQPTSPIRRNEPHVIRTRGIILLKAAHREIRRLKQEAEPSIHGNKVWNSSFLIMDYLTRDGFPRGARLMDVGCGWGPLSIFCARRFGAKVTAVDADRDVFPYLKLHAAINKVDIDTQRCRFEKLTVKKLRGVHTLCGADICFWDELTPVLFNLVRRALKAGVKRIIIADPGRSPFYNLAEKCEEAFPHVKVVERRTSTPRRASADLLVIESHRR
jgi:predicted nicotinamide N-methyase